MASLETAAGVPYPLKSKKYLSAGRRSLSRVSSPLQTAQADKTNLPTPARKVHHKAAQGFENSSNRTRL